MRCHSHVFDDVISPLSRRIRRRFFSRMMTALAVVTFMAASNLGMPSTAAAQGTETIELYNGLLGVEIPAEFEELRLTEMERTFPSLPLPDYVYSDRLRTTLLAVSIINNPNPDIDMLTYTAGWAKALEGTLPDFNWDQRRVARIEGRPWIVWQYNATTINQFKEPESSATVMFMSVLSKDVMMLVLGHAPKGIFAQNMEIFQRAVTSLDLSIVAPQMSGLKAATQ